MALEDMHGRTALLVDDEAFFLSSIVEILRGAAPGLEVLTASDGLEALAQLERRPVDVVVTDLQMPRLDGYGLITEMVARAYDTSVVVMTAFGRPSLREREGLALAPEFLEKPIDFGHLLDILGDIMRERTPRGCSNHNPGSQLDKDDMDNTQASLEKIGEINGTLGVSLVDYESGMTLGTFGSGLDLEIASAGNMEVMRAKQRVMRELGIDGGIEDILITLESQYHLIRPVGRSLFLYLALSRKDANLAMARRKLANIAAELNID